MIPRNPIDVLAQQIVAICADEEISVDELHELVRGAYNFADLSRVQLENVLDMLAGRYPSDEFAELRPRIVWDRTAGVIRGRSGARQLAVTNAGTIPDRGLYGVHLVDGGGRVGELDEEMVYEARAGQTFLLGASSWRIEEITRDRVLVSPAPGVPGLIPFWKGEGPGRPYELGEAIGKASRELAALPEKKALERLTEQHSLDEQAAQNLITFLSDQQDGDRRRAVRPNGRRRALPRRDRRLADVHPHAVRRQGARAVVDGDRLPATGLAGPRSAVALVGRRDRRPPARCGRSSTDGGTDRRPDGDRRARHGRARRHRALRLALSRERRSRAPDPTPHGRASGRRSGSSG